MIRTFGKEDLGQKKVFGRLEKELRPKTLANPRESVKTTRKELLF